MGSAVMSYRSRGLIVRRWSAERIGPRIIVAPQRGHAHVAISNHRLVDMTDDTVFFRWKDYRHGSQVRTLTLEAEEFLRRFLLHVLPKRFVRIRYFGFLASRCRTVQLPQCRRALAGATAPPPTPPPPEPPRSWPCPRCGAPMRVIERLTPRQIYLTSLLADLVHDTS